MLAKLPIEQQFYNWVASKDPNETYDYTSTIECACGRFAIEALGMQPYTREYMEMWDIFYFGDGPNFWLDARSSELFVPISPTALNSIARGLGACPEQWTYGKLRARLERTLPECVA